MNYEPTVWKKGDVVTSEKLNKLEQGIAGTGDIFVIGFTGEANVATLDKTWREIYDAANAGMFPFIKEVSANRIQIVPVYHIKDNSLDGYGYQVATYTGGRYISYIAESEDECPSIVEEAQ